jgi:hypothetical protein
VHTNVTLMHTNVDAEGSEEYGQQCSTDREITAYATGDGNRHLKQYDEHITYITMNTKNPLNLIQGRYI